MDDQNTPSEPVAETSAPAQAPEPAPTPVEPESSQPNGSTPTDLPSTAPESPTSVSIPIPVEDPNPPLNQPESDVPESSNEASIPEPIQVQSAPSSGPAPQTQPIQQPQSPAQQNQAGFIHGLFVKAQAKIQSNKQKKLDLLMQFTQKKGKITNDGAQKLLRISDKTADRYIKILVTQGRLQRSGHTNNAFYTLPR
jgi:hypothetical protein